MVTEEKRFYGIVSVYKDRILGLFDTGKLADASLSDVCMICPDKETAIKMMTLLNNKNYGLIDAPYGIASNFLVHHYVMMKMDTYTSYENDTVFYCYKTSNVFSDVSSAYSNSITIVKVRVNRYYLEGCCNA